MGNCLPKFKKKNKVHPDPRASREKRKEMNVSETISRSASSASIASGSSNEELDMLKEVSASDEESMYTSVESLIFKKEDSIMDELKETESVEVKKPIAFQVDFVQAMHSMPSRLASRMAQNEDAKKSAEQITFTEDDEALMDTILEEAEAKEEADRLLEQQLAAERNREQHLESIRERARGLRMRPRTRAGQCGDGVWDRGAGGGGDGG